MRSASAASTTAASTTAASTTVAERAGDANADPTASEAVAACREDETSRVLVLLGDTHSGDFGIAVLLQSDIALGHGATVGFLAVLEEFLGIGSDLGTIRLVVVVLHFLPIACHGRHRVLDLRSGDAVSLHDRGDLELPVGVEFVGAPQIVLASSVPGSVHGNKVVNQLVKGCLRLSLHRTRRLNRRDRCGCDRRDRRDRCGFDRISRLSVVLLFVISRVSTASISAVGISVRIGLSICDERESLALEASLVGDSDRILC